MAVILLSAAVFLALILYIAVEQDKREKFTGIAFFISTAGGIIIYGLSYSVEGRDCRFINGDNLDFRRSNLEILNTYHGVIPEKEGKGYIARIHTSGYTKVGTYDSALEAAIAYNKAVDIIKKSSSKQYPENFIDEVSGKIYADIYNSLEINPNIR